MALNLKQDACLVHNASLSPIKHGGEGVYYGFQSEFRCAESRAMIASTCAISLRVLKLRKKKQLNTRGIVRHLAESRRKELLFLLKINNFNCDKIMQQMKEWKYLCRFKNVYLISLQSNKFLLVTY